MVSRTTMPSGTHPALDGALSAEASARLERLYRLHADRVARLAYRRTGDHHLAQDIAGETWLQAANWIDTLKADDDNAIGWLSAIVKRAVAGHYRRPRTSEKPTDWGDPVTGRRLPAAPPAEDVLLADPAPELPPMWRDALARLTPAQRTALLWRSEGLSWRAIGSHVGRDHTSAADAARRGVRTLVAAVAR